MKKVLIYFTQFKRILGGSDFLPLMFISELQKEHEVTVALDWRSDFASASEQSGIPIDVSRLKVEYIKPRSQFIGNLDAVIPFYRSRRLQKLAKDADVCISAVNMFDFGKPAHHFVYLLRHFGDNAFTDYFSHTGKKRGMVLIIRKLRTWVGEYILRPMLGVRSTRSILADPREKIYPNSNYVKRVMGEFYGKFSGEVFYPPTIFEPKPGNTERNPLRVVYIGRLFPEKRLVEIIGIVEQARELSGQELEMHIAGNLDATPYVEQLKKNAAEKPWVRLVGPLYGNEKEAFLESATFAIHGERDEAFGISVVEYMKAGIIPLVPNEGGTPEIVDDPDLTYGNEEEAANMLGRLLKDEALMASKRSHCQERAAFFSLENYKKRQTELLHRIMADLQDDSNDTH